ncbi:helix-turn-helix transcriptional regulator [Paenibacillus sp. J31TS4]|uniref:helix-turn-helix transcriptional regulator n=1 Tax=Paenibacillus sp. J31TS4 TaxID=2807195 RepID=UPI001BCB1FE4|nr:helix-turn-helix transcriptional regulator [Paenibacillus sp. J31TS4]
MKAFLPIQPPMLQRAGTDASCRYQEFAPCKPLAPYVACYWTLDACSADAPLLHRIIPDGCVDIIVDLRSSSIETFAVGLMTGYETVSLTESSSFGIRFYPEHAHRFLTCPVSELKGGHVGLDDLWGTRAGDLAEQAGEARGIQERIEQVERSLLQALCRNEGRTDPLFHAGMQYIFSEQARLSVRAVADQLGTSERNLRRAFQCSLGISPKELLGILRFQFFLQTLRANPSSPFTDVALDMGYYDQPHAIRTFKRLYGLLPHQVFS